MTGGWRGLLGVFLLLSGLPFLPNPVQGASPEVRPAGQMSGTIIAPLEERKQALAAGDKVYVALDRDRPVKKGDLMEIYQPAPMVLEGKPLFTYTRAGEVIILESVNDRLFLAVIESSNKEISVGDRVYLPEHP